MAVTAQLLVRLMAEKGSRDQDSKLPVTQARDQARQFLDANSIVRRVALCLQREVQRNAIGEWPYAVRPDRIAASIYGWPGHRLDFDVWVHEPCQAGRAVLETVRVVLEVVVDNLHEQFIAASRGLLFVPGPIFDRGLRGQRFIDTFLDPRPPGAGRRRMEWLSCPDGVDPFATRVRPCPGS